MKKLLLGLIGSSLLAIPALANESKLKTEYTTIKNNTAKTGQL